MGATDEAQTPRDFECRRDRFRDLERLLRSRTGGCSGMRRLLEHLETAAPISLWVYSRVESMPWPRRLTRPSLVYTTFRSIRL